MLPSVIAVLVAYYTPYFQWAMLGLAGYYMLLGYALSRFVQASYANAVFDRYINKNIEGAEVNRGLYQDPDADDADDDESDDQPPSEG